MMDTETRKTVRKWFWVWDFEREEVWLNAMAMQGWALVKVGFCSFTFERCEPGEYVVRCEFREVLNKQNADYVAFIEELGVEYVGRAATMIYFRKKAEEGGFELFSDNASKRKHLNRMAACVGAIMAMNLVIGIVNSTMIPGAAPFGWINVALASVLAYGLGKIRANSERLEADSKLFE